MYENINDLPREKLLELISVYAKNWIATDGLWFQGVENAHGFDEALRIDVEMWGRFTVIEARRLIEFLDIPKRAGLEGLRRALSFRLYAPLNQNEMYYDGDSLIYRVASCRVQRARHQKGLAYHTCKPVGLIEHKLFAKAIDDRIETECISCHPDVTDPSCDCMWKFTLKE